MDERELNELLWRSWYLGMRIALRSLNVPDTPERLKECIRLLGEVARNETTLHESEYNLYGLDPQTKLLVIGIGNRAIIADRDLAPLIVAGLDQVTTLAEAPAESLPILPIHPDRPPLRVDKGSTVRVGNSRISLDLVIEQYENGMTPEEMVRVYDTLVLADVHAVIAYYLRHRDEVLAYLKQRGEEAGALQAKIEAERPRVSREELLARRKAREEANAPTGQ